MKYLNFARWLFAFSALGLMPLHSMAQSNVTARIASILTAADGSIFVDLHAQSKPNSCGAPGAYWFTSSEAGGKSTLAMLLLAYSLQETITITGNGQCSAANSLVATGYERVSFVNNYRP